MHRRALAGVGTEFRGLTAVYSVNEEAEEAKRVSGSVPEQRGVQ